MRKEKEKDAGRRNGSWDGVGVKRKEDDKKEQERIRKGRYNEGGCEKGG